MSNWDKLNVINPDVLNADEIELPRQWDKIYVTGIRTDETPVILGAWDRVWIDRGDVFCQDDGQEIVNILQRHMSDPWSKSTTQYLDRDCNKYIGVRMQS